MKRWHLAALLLAVGLSAAAIRSIWKNRAAQKREIIYQSALAKYTKQFGTGTSRKNVEDSLQGTGIKFGHMCCVERRDPNAAYLIRIGKEGAPWYCSQTTVFIAFEFIATEPNQLVEANPSDSLTKVSIFRQLEGCL
jgi:hypothetical protein